MGSGNKGLYDDADDDSFYDEEFVQNDRTFPGGRNQQEYDDLARDYSRGEDVSCQGKKEREIALDLEREGKLGHVVRDPRSMKGADFIDI